jgi:hypothetical protein
MTHDDVIQHNPRVRTAMLSTLGHYSFKLSAVRKARQMCGATPAMCDDV